MASIERDERPLAEINFAMDASSELRGTLAKETRAVFEDAGARIGQDIIDLGCTGLSVKLRGSAGWGQRIATARRYMSGSICGLPCYVPPDRFCLVHNGPGALQLRGNMDGPQAARHPEGVALCSRELTDAERAAREGVQAKIMADATDEATRMGAEIVSEPSARPPTEVELAVLSSEGAIPASWRFKCPEHTAFETKCRFCLAQAVVEGPFDPLVQLRYCVTENGSWSIVDSLASTAGVELLLPVTTAVDVQLYVLAARWVRKLTRE